MTGPPGEKLTTTAMLSTTVADELPDVQVARLDQNPAAVYLSRLSPGSRRTMRSSLDLIARLLTGDRADAITCPWALVRYQHAAAARSALTDLSHSHATINRHLAALRGVIRECWRLGFIDAETRDRTLDLERARGSSLMAGRMVQSGELAALFRMCAEDRTVAGRRDAALLAVAFGCGLRRAEIAGLELADYEPGTGELRVHGKGNKVRLTFVTGSAREALADWIAVRGSEEGPLFFAVTHGGRFSSGGLRNRKLSTDAIFRIFLRRAEQAAVLSCTPHDARRTFISSILDATGDLAAAQRLAGHASPTQTAAYDRRPQEAMRRAAEAVHIPFVRPQSRDTRRGR